MAVLHDDHPIGHGQSLLLVVGHQDKGDAELTLEALQLDLHIAAQPRVEGRKRLVQKQHPRGVDDRPGKSHTLLLAAGELSGVTFGISPHPDLVKDLVDPFEQLLPFDSFKFQTEGHIFRNRHVGEKRIALKHGVDLALFRRQG